MPSSLLHFYQVISFKTLGLVSALMEIDSCCNCNLVVNVWLSIPHLKPCLNWTLQKNTIPCSCCKMYTLLLCFFILYIFVHTYFSPNLTTGQIICSIRSDKSHKRCHHVWLPKWSCFSHIKKIKKCTFLSLGTVGIGSEEEVGNLGSQ